MGRTLDRHHAGIATEAHCRPRAQARVHGDAARRGYGDHHHRTDAFDCRNSVRRHEIGWTHSPPSARSKTMTDEQLAAMHRLLAEYHRKLAKEAMLDVVQQYQADLAQRLADEAALIPRRTAILERVHEREQQKKMASAPVLDDDPAPSPLMEWSGRAPALPATN